MPARPSPAEPSRTSDATRSSDAERSIGGTRTRGEARPSSFIKLSLIALACFAVGLSWPVLADFQFVQRPPGSTPSKSEEREPPPLDVESESKPSAPPPPAQRSPLARDQGVRAAAKVAPAASERARPRESNGDELVVMSGQATIGWKAAVVRKGPTSQAETVERIAYGTRVSVTGRQGDWYRIKYGRKGQTGWVHRKALGL